MKNSKRKITVLFAFLTALFLCLPGLMTGKAAPKGRTPPPPNVNATFADGFLLSGEGDTYTYVAPGTDEVFTSSGGLSDWVLNFNYQPSSAHVSVTFNSNWTPEPGEPANPPLPNGPYPTPPGAYTNVNSQCDVPFASIPLNSSLNNCSLKVAVNYNGISYWFVMSPAYPGTGSATVACTGATGSNCTSWTITGSGLADLWANPSSRKQTLLGTASNSFSINVAVVPVN